MDERRLGRIRAAPPLSWPPAPSSIFVSLAPVTTSAGLQINRRSSVGVRIRRRSPRPQHLPSWVHRPTPLKAPSTATCFSKKKDRHLPAGPTRGSLGKAQGEAGEAALLQLRRSRTAPESGSSDRCVREAVLGHVLGFGTTPCRGSCAKTDPS
jgi:hypothetical protein